MSQQNPLVITKYLLKHPTSPLYVCWERNHLAQPLELRFTPRIDEATLLTHTMMSLSRPQAENELGLTLLAVRVDLTVNQMTTLRS